MNILEQWGVSLDELSEAILANGSLHGMVFGYVAEIKLRELLQHPDVSQLGKDDDHDRKKKGDLRLVYRGREFKIEAKSLQTARNKQAEDGTFAGVSQVDASDRRTVTLPDGSQLQTTNLLVGEFDVLAVNCFSFEGKWNFAFARNADLPRSTFRAYSEEQRAHLLATLVPVQWPPKGIFRANVFSLLDEMIVQRQRIQPENEPVVVQEKGEEPRVIEEK